MPHHSKLETPQQTLDTGRHNPHLQSKQKNGLGDGDVETTQFLSVCALLPQDTIQLILDPSGLLKVGYDGHLIVVSFFQEAPQVLKE